MIYLLLCVLQHHYSTQKFDLLKKMTPDTWNKVIQSIDDALSATETQTRRFYSIYRRDYPPANVAVLANYKPSCKLQCIVMDVPTFRP